MPTGNVSFPFETTVVVPNGSDAMGEYGAGEPNFSHGHRHPPGRFVGEGDDRMPSLIITQNEDGSSVTAATGTLVELHLAENPTTGYQWCFEEVGPGLELVHDEFHHAGTPLVPGAGGVHEWRFRVADRGSHQLRLRLRREWEDESAAIGRFTVDIVAD